MMFGGILNYDFHRYRLYLDYMYMPEVYSNHVGIGITMLFLKTVDSDDYIFSEENQNHLQEENHPLDLDLPLKTKLYCIKFLVK